MKITLESTTKIVEVNGGIKCRVWEGRTDSGIPISALIPRIAAVDDGNLAEFEKELREQKAPSVAIEAWPLRLIL